MSLTFVVNVGAAYVCLTLKGAYTHVCETMNLPAESDERIGLSALLGLLKEAVDERFKAPRFWVWPS